MRLADFYEGIGRAAYDCNWVPGTRPIKSPTRRAPLNLLEERAAVAADDLAFALQSGTVQAAILLNLPEKEAPKAKSLLSLDGTDLCKSTSEELIVDDIFKEFDENDLTDGNDLQEHQKFNRYLIKAEFWDSAWRENIDWQLSQLHVPVQFIHVVPATYRNSTAAFPHPLITYRPDLRYQLDQTLHGPIVVLRADHALGAMFSLGNIPPAEVNARYLSFRNRLIDEVFAAAWRWLAIHRGGNKAVGTREIIAAMTDYLEVQGIDGEANKLGEKGLEALARQVLNERRSSNCSGMVLKNTSPPKSFKPARSS